MKEVLRIYYLLCLFERKEFCAKEDVIAAISTGEDSLVSDETWYRVKNTMADSYGFNIKYHRSTETYSMHSNNKKIDKYKLLQVLQHFRMANFLETYISDGVCEIQNIELEPGLDFRSENIMEVLKMAISKKEQVLINHKGYYGLDDSNILVNPLYFKQYQNRWYLIVEDNQSKKFKSFGLDRISQVNFTGANFISRLKEAKEAFKQVVGVDLNGNGLQDILIEFTPCQKPYLESLKLHSSQEVIEDANDKYVIKLHVNPNYELQQQIQKFGNKAKVLEGDWICL